MRTPTVTSILLAVAAIVLGTWVASSHAATSEQVDVAIEKAKKFLYSQQQPDGGWESTPAPNLQKEGAFHQTSGYQWGGVSSLVTYSLLAAGDSPGTPALQKAIKFLTTIRTEGNYAAAMRLQVWRLIPNSREIREAVRHDYRMIINGMIAEGADRGMYSYFPAIKGHGADNSNGQLAVLGAWACEELGQEMPRGYWEIVDKIWRTNQHPNGGWSYRRYMPKATQVDPTTKIPNEYAPIMTMTTAGIATLFITRDFTKDNDANEARGNVADPNIEKAFKLVGDRFNDIFALQRGYEFQMYALYGLERIGVASGYKYIGNVDWYQNGADWLVKNQAGNGVWQGMGARVGTPLGLIFLARGRAPVVMNKLMYEVVDNGQAQLANWSQRPRDVANLTRYVGQQTENDFNWQVVNFKASPDDLHDAPILYIAGNQTLDFAVRDAEAKLKRFVEDGGLILGNADAASKNFVDSFRKLGAKLFPTYEFRELPDNHPIYTNQSSPRSKWGGRPKVLGLSNGVRELMLLLPDSDPAKAWQTRTNSDRGFQHQLGASIFLYAVDKQNLVRKGETWIVRPDSAFPADRTHRVARLQYNGNWNPEPGGWRRLAAITHNQRKLDIDVVNVTLGNGQLTKPAAAPKKETPAQRPSDAEIRKLAVKRIPPDQILAVASEPAKLEKLIQQKVAEITAELDAKAKADDSRKNAGSATFKLAHLTGTAALKLTDPQRQEILKFVQAGGTLLIDAAGGSTEFALSAESELQAIFKKDIDNLTVLPPDHPLYKAGGKPLGKVQYRSYARAKLGVLLEPRLRALMIDNRPAILFSSEDLTAGLVGQQVDGILGYAPASATDILTRIVLHATGESNTPLITPPPPATAPAPVTPPPPPKPKPTK